MNVEIQNESRSHQDGYCAAATGADILVLSWSLVGLMSMSDHPLCGECRGFCGGDGRLAEAFYRVLMIFG